MQTQREMAHDLIRAERLAVAGSLAAGVAHEVNNPLAAISSLVQTVHSKTDDPRAREQLSDALGHMDRIAVVLRELLELARPPARTVEVTSPNELLERTLRLLRHDKRFRSVSIETRLDPGLGSIHADPARLQQILTNVLLNAGDAVAGRADPRIQVATRETTDGGVELLVSDNGVGVSDEDRGRVFEPFFTTKPRGQGSGLGLAVCRELLREHHGSIALEPREGGGTTARIGLPRKAAAP